MKSGADPQKCYSFFKVGGGFRAEDYANIAHQTENKWIGWDPKKPPTKYVELGGGSLQYERPDVWIKPEDSVVLSVKAASVGMSPSFRTNFTLRFPRFKKLRMDRDWTTALRIQEFIDLNSRVEDESRNKVFKVEARRHVVKRLKKETVIAGYSAAAVAYSGSKTMVFEGLNFCVLSEALYPTKKSKGEIEGVIKANGGKIFQSPTAAGSADASNNDMICIADKKVVKVASLMKAGVKDVVRPKWVLDAVAQAESDLQRGMRERFIIPFEPTHMFSLLPKDEGDVSMAIDDFGDSYSRDVEVDELRRLLNAMPKPNDWTFNADTLMKELQERGNGMGEMKAWIFRSLRVYVEDPEALQEDQNLELMLSQNILRFAGASVLNSIDDKDVTHLVFTRGSKNLADIRHKMVQRKKMPRLVSTEWVRESFDEGTLLDEERYPPR